MLSQSRFLSPSPTLSFKPSLSPTSCQFPDRALSRSTLTLPISHRSKSFVAMISNSSLSDRIETAYSGIHQSEIDRFAEVGNQLADAAGDVIRKYFRKSFDIVDKEDLSPVTIADRAAEDSMVSIIQQNFPSHAMYTTSPHLFSGDAEVAFARVRSKVKVPLYGCDCYAYALLASGFVDLVIESGLKPYDFLSLIPVIEGAGGVITDWKGDQLHWEASSDSRAPSFNVVAAGDKQLHEQAVDSLQWQ